MAFGHGEMILALAVVKKLDREANELLQPALPRPLWADLVIEDLLTGFPSAKQASNGFKKAKGLARHHYGALSLTDVELTDALERA